MLAELPQRAHLVDKAQVHVGNEELIVVLTGLRNDPAAWTHEITRAVKAADVPWRLCAHAIDGTYEYSFIVEVDGLVPDEYLLEQNYPNPFNPSTSIKYQMPENGFVTIKVYDMLGNEVATLVNEVQEAGNHSVEFDAATVSSGIYFYIMQAGNFTQTKKMTLLK